jgi:hypothetical protein
VPVVQVPVPLQVPGVSVLPEHVAQEVLPVG